MVKKILIGIFILASLGYSGYIEKTYTAGAEVVAVDNSEKVVTFKDISGHFWLADIGENHYENGQLYMLTFDNNYTSNNREDDTIIKIVAR